MKHTQPSRIATSALLFLFASYQSFGCQAEENRARGEVLSYDCGTIAVHTVLALEGRAMPIDTLRAHLPAPSPKGHSMAELRAAAKACGLALTGVKLPRSNDAPDRPALVFLKQEDHGHFLVVRPVGHSGKLIQVIDSTGDPVVMDAVDLYASSQWTGLALIPVRPNWPLRIALGSTVFSGFAFVLLLAASRSRAARGGAAGPSATAEPAPIS